MKRGFIRGILYLLLLFFLSGIYRASVYADYVLPYPSYMPGNTLYRLSRLLDAAKVYWYWGTIASWKYHMSLGDKYLIEAKTLFEYKQYLLAVDALQRSDKEISTFVGLLSQARGEGKDVHRQTKETSDAMLVHQELLKRLQKDVPAEFLWQPEKAQSTKLVLGERLNNAIVLRDRVVQELISMR